MFSPGSRSAPLVIAFSELQGITTHVLPDERVAGYFALGIAQQTHETVAIVCTSGTALLNLAPAICEAFYQEVPLLVLTADRPAELIGIGENQAINQTEIYRNYVRASYTVQAEAAGKKELQQLANTIAQAIDLTVTKGYGPVHINIPAREPLYEAVTTELPIIKLPAKAKASAFKLSKTESVVYKQYGSRLFVVGMHANGLDLPTLIQQQATKLGSPALLYENTTCASALGVCNVDAVLSRLSEEAAKAYVPELLITFGNQIISKRLKQFFRKHPPKEHWHVSETGNRWDMFGKLTRTFACDTLSFLKALPVTKGDGTLAATWQQALLLAAKQTEQFAAKAPYSDFKVLHRVLSKLPKGSNLQLGNSTPVRYAQFFELPAGIRINSNRGTSGIDGCVSTAAGAALSHKRLTVSITGDVSFLYDSNALWNNRLSPNLRMVVINNSGGNIFRLIEGPNRVPQFERFFETRHNLQLKHLAFMYGIPYYFCGRFSDLDKTLKAFYKGTKGKPALLEIRTDGEVSAKVYKQYFEFIRANKPS